jgi:hypothetical protein
MYTDGFAAFGPGYLILKNDCRGIVDTGYGRDISKH